MTDQQATTSTTPGQLVDSLDIRTIDNEATLAALAAALAGPAITDQVTPAEACLLARAPEIPKDVVDAFAARIAQGEDPLGRIFCALRPPCRRRNDGAVYTPPAIVAAMLSWAETTTSPARVVDPGAGSARFLLEAGRRFPQARLIAVEQDPLAALTARANLAVNGMTPRAEVRVENFLTTNLRRSHGPTLFVGNPPYVRHHLIQPKWKRWLKRHAAALDLQASALAGLHVYFFLAIAHKAKAGDQGALITAAEWLDVNYGQLVRDLFLDRLGGHSIHVIEPKAEAFPGTATTGAITTFSVDSAPSSARMARVKNLSALNNLAGGRRVQRDRLALERRWSHFTRPPAPVPDGYVELGELCRVHRGQVTGANRVWIAGSHSEGLPDDVLFPAVTRARELIQAGPVLDDADKLKRVIDLPGDLQQLGKRDRAAVRDFLARAKVMGARDSYTARHRFAWWSVRLRAPAPILATYMARRAPAFVLNKADARHLNIAHGIYPREEMSPGLLSALVSYLRGASSLDGGRVYAGGLTKFEPREMERIAVPSPNVLTEMSA